MLGLIIVCTTIAVLCGIFVHNLTRMPLDRPDYRGAAGTYVILAVACVASAGTAAVLLVGYLG